MIKINNVLGALTTEDTSFIQGENSKSYLEQLKSKNKKLDFQHVFPKSSTGLIILLS